MKSEELKSFRQLLTFLQHCTGWSASFSMGYIWGEGFIDLFP